MSPVRTKETRAPSPSRLRSGPPALERKCGVCDTASALSYMISYMRAMATARHPWKCTRLSNFGNKTGACALGGENLGTRWSKLKRPVPSLIGMPMMMHSDTPLMGLRRTGIRSTLEPDAPLMTRCGMRDRTIRYSWMTEIHYD